MCSGGGPSDSNLLLLVRGRDVMWADLLGAQLLRVRGVRDRHRVERLARRRILADRLGLQALAFDVVPVLDQDSDLGPAPGAVDALVDRREIRTHGRLIGRAPARVLGRLALAPARLERARAFLAVELVEQLEQLVRAPVRDQRWRLGRGRWTELLALVVDLHDRDLTVGLDADGLGLEVDLGRLEAAVGRLAGAHVPEHAVGGPGALVLLREQLLTTRADARIEVAAEQDLLVPLVRVLDVLDAEERARAQDRDREAADQQLALIELRRSAPPTRR